MLKEKWPLNKLDEFWFFRWSSKICGEEFPAPDQQFRDFISRVEEVLGPLRGPAAVSTLLKWHLLPIMVGCLVGCLHDSRLFGLALVIALLPILFAVFRARLKDK
jgi:hypothetical protein